MTHFYKKIPSPVGELTLIADKKHLLAILWEKEKFPEFRLLADLKNDGANPILKKTEKQLKEYFTGKRTRFQLPIRAQGTVFQSRVWKGLQKIPYGKTQSYRELAERVGSPLACRAVGAANGRNPIPLVIPCHRVIGANGKLTGFTGGLENKKFLLNLEFATRARVLK